jgi:hypothetical protein
MTTVHPTLTAIVGRASWVGLLDLSQFAEFVPHLCSTVLLAEFFVSDAAFAHVRTKMKTAQDPYVEFNAYRRTAAARHPQSQEMHATWMMNLHHHGHALIISRKPTARTRA